MNIRITTIVTCILMSTCLISSCQCQTLKNDTTLRTSSGKFFVNNGIYKLKEMWRKLEDMGKDENTFVGNVIHLLYFFIN